MKIKPLDPAVTPVGGYVAVEWDDDAWWIGQAVKVEPKRVAVRYLNHQTDILRPSSFKLATNLPDSDAYLPRDYKDSEIAKFAQGFRGAAAPAAVPVAPANAPPVVIPKVWAYQYAIGKRPTRKGFVWPFDVDLDHPTPGAPYTDFAGTTGAMLKAVKPLPQKLIDDCDAYQITDDGDAKIVAEVGATWLPSLSTHQPAVYDGLLMLARTHSVALNDGDQKFGTFVLDKGVRPICRELRLAYSTRATILTKINDLLKQTPLPTIDGQYRYGITQALPDFPWTLPPRNRLEDAPAPGQDYSEFAAHGILVRENAVPAGSKLHEQLGLFRIVPASELTLITELFQRVAQDQRLRELAAQDLANPVPRFVDFVRGWLAWQATGNNTAMRSVAWAAQRLHMMFVGQVQGTGTTKAPTTNTPQPAAPVSVAPTTLWAMGVVPAPGFVWPVPVQVLPGLDEDADYGEFADMGVAKAPGDIPADLKEQFHLFLMAPDNDQVITDGAVRWIMDQAGWANILLPYVNGQRQSAAQRKASLLLLDAGIEHVVQGQRLAYTQRDTVETKVRQALRVQGGGDGKLPPPKPVTPAKPVPPPKPVAPPEPPVPGAFHSWAEVKGLLMELGFTPSISADYAMQRKYGQIARTTNYAGFVLAVTTVGHDQIEVFVRWQVNRGHSTDGLQHGPTLQSKARTPDELRVLIDQAQREMVEWVEPSLREPADRQQVAPPTVGGMTLEQGVRFLADFAHSMLAWGGVREAERKDVVRWVSNTNNMTTLLVKAYGITAEAARAAMRPLYDYEPKRLDGAAMEQAFILFPDLSEVRKGATSKPTLADGRTTDDVMATLRALGFKANGALWWRYYGMLPVDAPNYSAAIMVGIGNRGDNTLRIDMNLRRYVVEPTTQKQVLDKSAGREVRDVETLDAFRAIYTEWDRQLVAETEGQAEANKDTRTPGSTGRPGISDGLGYWYGAVSSFDIDNLPDNTRVLGTARAPSDATQPYFRYAPYGFIQLDRLIPEFPRQVMENAGLCRIAPDGDVKVTRAIWDNERSNMGRLAEVVATWVPGTMAPPLVLNFVARRLRDYTRYYGVTSMENIARLLTRAVAGDPTLWQARDAAGNVPGAQDLPPDRTGSGRAGMLLTIDQDLRDALRTLRAYYHRVEVTGYRPPPAADAPYAQYAVNGFLRLDPANIIRPADMKTMGLRFVASEFQLVDIARDMLKSEQDIADQMPLVLAQNGKVSDELRRLVQAYLPAYTETLAVPSVAAVIEQMVTWARATQPTAPVAPVTPPVAPVTPPVAPVTPPVAPVTPPPPPEGPQAGSLPADAQALFDLLEPKIKWTNPQSTEDRNKYLRRLWMTLNSLKFGGRLAPPSAVRMMNASEGFKPGGGRTLGYWVPATRLLAINPSGFVQNRAMFYVTMLHEMCHQAVTDIDRVNDRTADGHGPNWQAWMNRVGLSPSRYADADAATPQAEVEARQALLSGRQVLPRGDARIGDTVVFMAPAAAGDNAKVLLVGQITKFNGESAQVMITNGMGDYGAWAVAVKSLIRPLARDLAVMAALNAGGYGRTASSNLDDQGKQQYFQQMLSASRLSTKTIMPDSSLTDMVDKIGSLTVQREFAQWLIAARPDLATLLSRFVGEQSTGDADMAEFVKVAADSVDKLRKPDVDRVLDNVPPNQRIAFIQWLTRQRPDLTMTVNNIMAERMGTKKPVTPTAPAGSPV